MELNLIASGIELLGATVKELEIKNQIVDIAKDAKRVFGLNICEPKFQTDNENNEFYAEMIIEFEIEITQSENSVCKIHLALEGAFLSNGDTDYDDFQQLVAINGASALIGIARGKLESISASVFNNGKIVIPFVNVIDYYKAKNVYHKL